MASEPVSTSRHYFARTTKIEDVKSYYDSHADEYDEDLENTTYLYPGASSAIDTLLEAVGEKNVNIKILDLGAGTGILSVALNKRGFNNIDAIDLSQKMLDKAKERNLYKNYFCAAVEDKRLDDIPTGTYDAIISTGAVSSGMIKPIAFDEISRFVRQGGYICFTLRKDVYDRKEYGYQQKFQKMQDEGRLQEMEKFLSPYYENAIEMQKECYVFCFKVL